MGCRKVQALELAAIGFVEGGEIGPAGGWEVGGIEVGGHPLDDGFAVGFGNGIPFGVEGFAAIFFH
jgi:hypothetical protein